MIMNDKTTELLIKDYEAAVNAIAEAFLNKQFVEDGEPRITVDGDDAWWASDDVGGTLFYGDFSYSFDDILTDLKEDAPRGEVQQYIDYVVRCANLKISYINYHSWLMGAPHASDDKLTHLERLKERLEKEIKEENDK